MKSKTKHSPTPWQIWVGHTEILANVTENTSLSVTGDVVAVCDPDHYHGCDSDHEAQKLAEANAAYIVHCVNSHEAMREALEHISKAIPCIGTDENNDTCGVTFTCGNCRLAGKARAVLASLKDAQ